MPNKTQNTNIYMSWYPERYASGDIQTTTMTLHIANKAGGATLGAEIFFNVKYSTSEEEKNCHMANKVEETLATKIFFCVEKAWCTIHAECTRST